MSTQNAGLDINISGAFPLEGLVEKFLDVWIRARETQDDDIRREFDLIALKWMKRCDAAIDKIAPLPGPIFTPKQIAATEAPNGTH